MAWQMSLSSEGKERYSSKHSHHLNTNSKVGGQHTALATLPLGKKIQYHCTGSLVSLKAGQGQSGPVHSTLPHNNENPDCPVHNEALHHLRYPSHPKWYAVCTLY